MYYKTYFEQSDGEISPLLKYLSASLHWHWVFGSTQVPFSWRTRPFLQKHPEAQRKSWSLKAKLSHVRPHAEYSKPRASHCSKIKVLVELKIKYDDIYDINNFFNSHIIWKKTLIFIVNPYTLVFTWKIFIKDI